MIDKSVRVFANDELMPRNWSDGRSSDGCVFNPALTVFDGQLLMAYRVVTADGQRRLAICRLTPALQVVPGSVVALSDSIQNGGEWHADARFCTLGGQLFLHYNDGARKEGNHIFLVNIDPDSLEAAAPARQLVMDGPRRSVEKNWMLFEHDDELWAIYTISPHVVLTVDLKGKEMIKCRPVFRSDWNTDAYTLPFGPMRGGAPPQRYRDGYISVFHSCFPVWRLRSTIRRLLGKRPTRYIRYVAGVYGFAASPPFAPQWLHPRPIIHPPRLPRRWYPQLDARAERIAYPCGSVFYRGAWLVSFGAENEYCCIAILDRILPNRL
ncbi:MAG: hypothetical protein IAE81_17505 [Caldilineaceae bacterium]|nr:hypothetical protein [Caldilineaceae bacterium]